MTTKNIGSYDVVVAGGGPTGVVAALAAARQGASTLIVEQYGFLGGLAVTGLPLLSFHTVSGRQVFKGIPQEVVDRLVEIGGSPGHVRGSADSHVGTMTPIYPEEFKYLIERMLREAGVDILLHAKVIGAVADGGSVKGITLGVKEGVGDVKAKVIVDATGDADVLAFAGGGFEVGRAKDSKVQSMTTLMNLANVNEKEAAEWFPKELFYATRPGEDGEQLIHIHGGLGRWRDKAGKEYPFMDKDHGLWAMILRPGQLNLNITDIIDFDGLTSSGLTGAEIEGRRQVFAIYNFLKKYVPGFRNSFVNFSCHTVGVRETRRLKGLYRLTKEDVIRCEPFEDVVARSAYSIDLHDPEGKGIGFEMQQKSDEPYDIPYRCLVPEKLNGLLAAGRSISATHEALASCRVMAICMALGEAAGTAAGMSAKAGIQPRDIKVAELQQKLKATGALL